LIINSKLLLSLLKLLHSLLKLIHSLLKVLKSLLQLLLLSLFLIFLSLSLLLPFILCYSMRIFKRIYAQVDRKPSHEGLIVHGDSLVQYCRACLADNTIRGSRLGIFQDGLRVLVQDRFLKGLHAVAEVTDEGLEAFVVGDLFELELPNLLQVELDTFNPRVDIMSIDEVLLGFDKVLVVQLLFFEPIPFVLAKKTEQAVAQAL
jgi:hypothetical protein